MDVMPSRPRAVQIAALVVVAAIGVVACGAEDSAPPGPSGGSSPHPVAGPLSFTAPVLSGGQLDGASLAGQTVMLWFWAPT